MAAAKPEPQVPLLDGPLLKTPAALMAPRADGLEVVWAVGRLVRGWVEWRHLQQLKPGGLAHPHLVASRGTGHQRRTAAFPHLGQSRRARQLGLQNARFGRDPGREPVLRLPQWSGGGRLFAHRRGQAGRPSEFRWQGGLRRPPSRAGPLAGGGHRPPGNPRCSLPGGVLPYSAGPPNNPRWPMTGVPTMPSAGPVARRGTTRWSNGGHRWSCPPHTHRPALIAANAEFPYDQLVGGGPQADGATLISGTADANELRLTCRLLGGATVHEAAFKPLV